MENCVFCKIVGGDLPAHAIYENKKILAFLDINPVKPGHILVIPKDHYPAMTDAPDPVIADIFVEAKKLMIALKRAMAADFVTLSVVGTDVPHLHIHLTPRHLGDGLSGWPTKKYGKKEEAEKIAEKIKSELR
jgi:histidine triad (HIT) family protein